MAMPPADPAVNPKRVFVLGVTEAEARERWDALLFRQYAESKIFPATDAPDLLRKIENAPPHVVLLSDDLPKLPNNKVLKAIFEISENDHPMAVVVLGDPPVKQDFIDQVVTGQLQFIGTSPDPDAMIKAFNRALNYLENGSGGEFNLKYLSPGDCLIKQGEKGESVFVVKKGTLNAILNIRTEAVILGAIEAGEFVGEMAFINGEPRACDVVAYSPCEVIEIPFDHFDHLIFRKPAWSKALMKTLSKRVKASNLKK